VLPYTSRPTLYWKKPHLYRLTNQASECNGLIYSFHPYHWNLLFPHTLLPFNQWLALWRWQKQEGHVCACVCVYEYMRVHTHIGEQWLATCFLYKSVPMLGHKTTWGFSDNNFPTFLLDFSHFPSHYAIRCDFQKSHLKKTTDPADLDAAKTFFLSSACF